MGRTWVLVALGACAVLVAVSRTAGRIELVDRHSGIAPLHPQRAGGAFTNDWDGWLRKVTLQVRAAVDLSKGLSAAKKERLDGILAHDVVRVLAPFVWRAFVLRAGTACKHGHGHVT
jgi:hypothetical protein